MPPLVCAAGRVPDRDPAEGPGDPRHERQNEDARRAAPGLPAAHCSSEGIPLCQGRTLQHAAGRLRGTQTTARGEEPPHREEDATNPTGKGTSSC